MENEHAATEVKNQAPTAGDKRVGVKNEGVAAVLSLILPGLGQFYSGHFIWGIVWLIITPGFWIGTGGTLGWVFHILSSIQAYRQAIRKNSPSY